MWKSKFYGALVLNHRVVLHAIDATPVRWRGDAGFSPLDRATALCNDPSATLDDVREAVTTLEDADRIGRRVFGVSHPTTAGIEDDLQNTRAALRARETPPTKGES